jgi:ATP-dependent RNA helicase RhlE
MSVTSFDELGLSPEILRAVTEAGYTTPTPIQAQAIPVVMAGLDVMGGAQTGTGKTAGFALPILQRLQRHANASPSPARHTVRALILAPTRELAIQVEEAIKEYGKYTGLRSTCVFGGVDINQQLPIVRAGVEILVATPGRLLDHIEHKSVNLGQVEIFVLDEADRMLDMGFIPDIKRIMALLPATAKRQNLLWSATFSNEIKRLADQLLNEPQLIEVARRNEAADTVTQRAYKCPQDAKRALLSTSSNRATSGRCFASCAPSTARRASRGNSKRTASSPRRSTATRRSRRASRRSRNSRKASCRSWSPPTSPRADSTSTTCRS